MKEHFNVLGIETTCDETAASIVTNGCEILSNIVASQDELHAAYGGVFPELACRQHVEAIIPVIEESLRRAEVKPEELDLISVARGPGLIGALLIGISAAQALAMAWNKPLIGINHIEAHLYAAMIREEQPLFPAIGLVISGGHTCLVKILDIGRYELIGQTVDDAIGEAFDKVASVLGLPYPGGPAIEKLAKRGDPKRFDLNPGRVRGKPWAFSFSGLKTNVLYHAKGQNCTKESSCILDDQGKADLAASFQDIALKDVLTRAVKAAQEHGCKAIYCGGGVSQNQRLRKIFNQLSSKIELFCPELELCGDNAAMIAGLAYHQFKRNDYENKFTIEPAPRLPFWN